MIVLDAVRVVAGRFRLEAISLSIQAGEYWAVVGPSGAGKTVLLETIAGVREVEAGRILIDGADMTDRPPQDRKVGLVYQDYALFPHMTVQENVGFGPRMQHQSDDSDESLRLLGIGHLADRLPGGLSGGEQQRVAIARALAARPRVLLLDEPFSALDQETREECAAMIQTIARERGLTVVQVTHYPAEVAGVATHLAEIQEGRLVRAGPVDDFQGL
jgi:ABC-type Fe3+/spermidine/putrescine transport system ATPase subunit